MKSIFASVIVVALFTGSALAAGPARKLCTVGNSITAITHYPDTLLKLLKRDSADYTWTVVNEGVSSTTMLRKGNFPYWTTPVTGTTGFKDVFTQQPNIVTIELGTNDCKSYNWDFFNGNFIADYEAMIDTFSHMASHPLVYIVLPTPLFEPDTGEIRDTCLQKEIPLLWQVAAAKNVPVIDGHTMLLHFPNYFADGIHPTLGGGPDSLACVYYRALTGRSAQSTDTSRHPLMIVSDTSDTSLKFTVSVGQTGTTAQQLFYIGNPYAATVPLDSVVISGQANWLVTQPVSRTNFLQVTAFSVNCGSVPQSVQTLFDTLTLTSALASPATKKILVMLVVRQPPVATALKFYATPDTTLMVPGQQRTFQAFVYDQYGAPLALQPVLSWSASAGGITGGTYTASSTPGIVTIQASSGGLSHTVTVFVSDKVTLLPPGNIGELLLLKNASTGSYAITPKGTTSPLDSNYFTVPESTVVPMPESTVTVGTTKYQWQVATKANLRWFDSASVNNFVGIAALYFYSPCARGVALVQRNAWQLKMLLNNKTTIKSDINSWGFDTLWDHSIYSVNVKKGMNLCLFKLWGTTGDKFFSMRFTDSMNTLSLPDIAYQFTPALPAIPGLTGVMRQAAAPAGARISVRTSAHGDICIAVPLRGPSTIELFTVNGRCAAIGHIDNAGDYVFAGKTLGANIYLVKVTNRECGSCSMEVMHAGRTQ
jgi:alpha-L-fucosidase 2